MSNLKIARWRRGSRGVNLEVQLPGLLVIISGGILLQDCPQPEFRQYGSQTTPK